MSKVSAFHKDILAKLVSGKTETVGFETAYTMWGEGVITELFGNGTFGANDRTSLTEAHLTAAGRTIGTERAAELAARRTKANAGRKARDGAMRSLGMTKTKYGWE